MRWILAILLAAAPAAAQNGLRQQVRAIADQAQGKVSTACWLEGAPLNCDLNPHGHPPMQSVFKLPLGIAVLHQVEQGKLKLDQPVRFQPSDRILPHAYSPLQDKYPQAGVDVPLSELLRLTVSLSDNVAADILLRLAGGPAVVNSYIASLGIRGFHLVDNENALHHQKDLQYRNWFEPAGAVELLRMIDQRSPLNSANTAFLLEIMSAPPEKTRLGADLPAGTKIAHKTGSSDVDNGLAHATNDIGLITLPDGRKLAVAVFVTDSRADEATRIRVIAEIGKAAYDAAAAQHRAR
ncbi:MAG TPA: class A beta-lactamase [Terracidiphilus sp.]|nr:class A beta-lactamase [Terracidiphilus sp.]